MEEDRTDALDVLLDAALQATTGGGGTEAGETASSRSVTLSHGRLGTALSLTDTGTDVGGFHSTTNNLVSTFLHTTTNGDGGGAGDGEADPNGGEAPPALAGLQLLALWKLRKAAAAAGGATPASRRASLVPPQGLLPNLTDTISHAGFNATQDESWTSANLPFGSRPPHAVVAPSQFLSVAPPGPPPMKRGRSMTGTEVNEVRAASAHLRPAAATARVESERTTTALTEASEDPATAHVDAGCVRYIDAARRVADPAAIAGAALYEHPTGEPLPATAARGCESYVRARSPTEEAPRSRQLCEETAEEHQQRRPKTPEVARDTTRYVSARAAPPPSLCTTNIREGAARSRPASAWVTRGPLSAIGGLRPRTPTPRASSRLAEEGGRAAHCAAPSVAHVSAAPADPAPLATTRMARHPTFAGEEAVAPRPRSAAVEEGRTAELSTNPDEAVHPVTSTDVVREAAEGPAPATATVAEGPARYLAAAAQAPPTITSEALTAAEEQSARSRPRTARAAEAPEALVSHASEEEGPRVATMRRRSVAVADDAAEPPAEAAEEVMERCPIAAKVCRPRSCRLSHPPPAAPAVFTMTEEEEEERADAPQPPRRPASTRCVREEEAHVRAPPDALSAIEAVGYMPAGEHAEEEEEVRMEKHYTDRRVPVLSVADTRSLGAGRPLSAVEERRACMTDAPPERRPASAEVCEAQTRTVSAAQRSDAAPLFTDQMAAEEEKGEDPVCTASEEEEAAADSVVHSSVLPPSRPCAARCADAIAMSRRPASATSERCAELHEEEGEEEEEEGVQMPRALHHQQVQSARLGRRGSGTSTIPSPRMAGLAATEEAAAQEAATAHGVERYISATPEVAVKEAAMDQPAHEELHAMEVAAPQPLHAEEEAPQRPKTAAEETAPVAEIGAGEHSASPMHARETTLLAEEAQPDSPSVAAATRRHVGDESPIGGRRASSTAALSETLHAEEDEEAAEEPEMLQAEEEEAERPKTTGQERPSTAAVNYSRPDTSHMSAALAEDATEKESAAATPQQHVGDESPIGGRRPSADTVLSHQLPPEAEEAEEKDEPDALHSEEEAPQRPKTAAEETAPVAEIGAGEHSASPMHARETTLLAEEAQPDSPSVAAATRRHVGDESPIGGRRASSAPPLSTHLRADETAGEERLQAEEEEKERPRTTGHARPQTVDMGLEQSAAASTATHEATLSGSCAAEGADSGPAEEGEEEGDDASPGLTPAAAADVPPSDNSEPLPATAESPSEAALGRRPPTAAERAAEGLHMEEPEDEPEEEKEEQTEEESPEAVEDAPQAAVAASASESHLSPAPSDSAEVGGRPVEEPSSPPTPRSDDAAAPPPKWRADRIVSPGFAGIRPVQNPYRSCLVSAEQSTPWGMCYPYCALLHDIRSAEELYLYFCGHHSASPESGYKVRPNSAARKVLRAAAPPTPPTPTVAAAAAGQAAAGQAAGGAGDVDPANLRSITALSFAHLCMRDSGVLPLLEVLRWCPNLVSLDLSGNELSNEAVEWLAELQGSTDDATRSTETMKSRKTRHSSIRSVAPPMAETCVSNRELLLQVTIILESEPAAAGARTPTLLLPLNLLSEVYGSPLGRLQELRLNDNTLSTGALRLLKRMLKAGSPDLERVEMRGVALAPIRGAMPKVPPVISIS